MKTVFLAFMLMTCSAFSQNTEKMTDEECNEKASLLMHNTDDDTHRYYFSINASVLKKCKK